MYFRKKQPLKSRGIIPFAVVFIRYFILLSSFGNFYLKRDIRTQYRCFLDELFKIPGTMILVTLLLVDYSRVVLLITMKQHKSLIRNSRSTILFFIFKLLKFLISDIAVILYIIFSFLLTVFFNFLIFSASSFECTSASTIALFFMLLYIIIFCLFMIGVLLLFDFLMSLKKIITCKWKELFFFDDPFYFRIQQIIGLVSLFIVISIGCISIATPRIVSSLLQNRRLIYFSNFTYLIFHSTIFYVITFYLVGFINNHNNQYLLLFSFKKKKTSFKTTFRTS